VIITTSPKPSGNVLEQAGRLSIMLSAKLIPRSKHSVSKLVEENGEVIVVTEGEVRLYDRASESPLFFHPSMAFVRVKRLRRGESDPLITLSACEKGDTIIDCTAGLASDSIVFSYAAGADGNVTALESEPVLAALIKEGLAHYKTGFTDVDDAMRKIRVECANHLEYLANQPDNSADIVYFDPMFRQPIHESSAIGSIRTLANPNELSLEAVEQAKRVARRTVILKEHRDSGEFARLGFKRMHVNTSKIAYGVIKLEQE